METATVDLAARAVSDLARRLAAKQRAKDLREARALIRKHGLQTHEEVIDILSCVAGCLHFNFEEVADKLVEMVDELEGDPTADHGPADESWKRRQDRAMGDAS
jgi:hypothetical protein